MDKLVKRAVSKVRRYGYPVVGALSLIGGSVATNVFAGTADVGVTTAFTGIGSDLIATVGAVAPFAIGVMACMLGFKYGKKIFKLVANG